ncbi:MAG: hypothetical protein U0136_20050 [Bdellovibrionota bacterium]
MSLVLLRPQILSYKNRLIGKGAKSWLNRESIALIVSIGLVFGVYVVNVSFIQSLVRHPGFDIVLLDNLLRLFFFGFFVLLLFSNTIVALSSLYMSQEISLLLTAPLSSVRIFTAKFIEIVLTSSWLFLIFALPITFAYAQALDLPPTFLATAVLSVIPFTVLPAAFAIIVVTLFVNLIPPHRMRDILVVISFVFSCGLLFFGHQSPDYFPNEERKMNELVTFLSTFRDPQPFWLPSRWFSELLSAALRGKSDQLPLWWAIVLSATVGLVSAAFLVFDTYFRRGLNISSQGSKQVKVYSSDVGSMIARILVPFNSQFRALLFKEARMFIRDTTQALQLMMLLLLTFMYLYNFRSLKTASHFSDEGVVWWQVILALANIAFGACVVAAISTRFVFPSISLEGRAYSLLRATPLSVEQFLRYKFAIWIGPITVLALVLLVSGTMAIEGTFQTIAATSVVAIALSIGITGLGVGAGAYYAKFDWESPAQVTASFGSLVYMLLSLTVIICSIVPTIFLFILTCVPEFATQMSTRDYVLSVAGSALLLFLINVAAMRRALTAGANSLRELGS